MRRLLLAGAAVLSCAALAGSAHARGPVVFVQFRTPSGNIGCGYTGGMGPGSLRCDIASGLEPRPARPKGCVCCRHLAWGDSYTMSTTSRVILTCHGDTVIPHTPTLRYGKRWRRGGFVCLSRAVGLRCKNHSGHGFFLSRQHSYKFWRNPRIHR